MIIKKKCITMHGLINVKLITPFIFLFCYNS